MSNKPYWEKLKDPQWQKKRLEVLERAEWECSDCGSKDKTLHVHHRYYVSKREPWDYPISAYEALCAECHERRQDCAKTQPEPWEIFLDDIGREPLFCATEDALRGRMNPPDRIVSALISTLEKL
jgi:hypothetical protein